MTGTEKDVSQYISLALYLTPPPALETSVELAEMPPDSTQVVEMVPLAEGLCRSRRPARDVAGCHRRLRRRDREAARSAVQA